MAGVAPSQTTRQTELHYKAWPGYYNAFDKSSETGPEMTAAADSCHWQPRVVRSAGSFSGEQSSAERSSHASYSSVPGAMAWPTTDFTGFGLSRQEGTHHDRLLSSPRVKTMMPYTATDDQVRNNVDSVLCISLPTSVGVLLSFPWVCTHQQIWMRCQCKAVF